MKEYETFQTFFKSFTTMDYFSRVLGNINLLEFFNFCKYYFGLKTQYQLLMFSLKNVPLSNAVTIDMVYDNIKIFVIIWIFLRLQLLF